MTCQSGQVSLQVSHLHCLSGAEMQQNLQLDGALMVVVWLMIAWNMGSVAHAHLSVLCCLHLAAVYVLDPAGVKPSDPAQALDVAGLWLASRLLSAKHRKVACKPATVVEKGASSTCQYPSPYSRELEHCIYML